MVIAETEVAVTGTPFVKNIERSVQIAKMVRAKKQQCFQNAWRVVERLDPSAVYVEGFSVEYEDVVLEHAWVELDGEIIDPTLPHADMRYFPGLRYVGKEGLVEAQSMPGMLECGCYLPIFYRFGWNGIDNVAFTNARIAAEKYAYGESISEPKILLYRERSTNSDKRLKFLWDR